MRDRITFKCSECGEENYIGTRNKRKNPERMQIQKFCPRCNKKTLHKEKKEEGPTTVFFIREDIGNQLKHLY